MTIRSAPRPLARSLTLLAALAVSACKGPPPMEPMYAGEAQTKPVIRRTLQREQPPPRTAVGALVEPEDCRGSFGAAVAVRGSVVVVGAPKAGEAGKAWVYDAERLDRAPICLLPPPGVQAERFGASVSISPSMDRIVVGAPFAEVEGVAEMGRVYLWHREGEAWKFERAFTDTDPTKGPARLGRAVIVDDQFIYAGAPNASMEIRDDVEVPEKRTAPNDSLEGSDTGRPTRTESRLRGRFENEGAVLIWSRTKDGTWTGPLYALLPRGRPGARFGSTLTLRTEVLSARKEDTGALFSFTLDSLAVGAPAQRTKHAVEGGTVSIFLRPPNEPWRSDAKVLLAPMRAESGDLFGSSIALGDGVLAVGSPLANLDVATDVGEVAIFQQNVETRYWVEGEPSLSSPMPEANSRFGASVATVGQLLIVGQPGATRTDGSGRAFIFRKLGEGVPAPDGKVEQPWKPIAELVAPPFLKAREFGGTMSAGDDWVAVGACGEGARGSVALFRIDRNASGVTTPAQAPAVVDADAAPSNGSTEAQPAAAPAGTTATQPSDSNPPAARTPAAAAPPTRGSVLAPSAPGALQPGGNRPPPLPTRAEPASLFETPPETRPPSTATSPRNPANEAPKEPPESPYETPPETPGTKP